MSCTASGRQRGALGAAGGSRVRRRPHLLLGLLLLLLLLLLGGRRSGSAARSRGRGRTARGHGRKLGAAGLEDLVEALAAKLLQERLHAVRLDIDAACAPREVSAAPCCRCGGEQRL